MRVSDIMENNHSGYFRNKNNFVKDPVVFSFVDKNITSIRRNNIIQDFDTHPMTAYDLLRELHSVDFVVCDKYGKWI